MVAAADSPGREDDKHDNYYYGLDNQTKKKLDEGDRLTWEIRGGRVAV